MASALKVASNTFYLFIDWIIVTLIGYSFWFVLGKMLPPSDVGAFSAILNMALILSPLTSLGLIAAATKLIAEYKARKEEGKLIGTIKWSFKIATAANLAAAIAIILIAPLFGFRQFDALLLSATLVALSIFQLPASYLWGLQQMKKFAMTDAMGLGGKLVLLIIFIYFGFKYEGAVYALFIAFVITGLYRLWILPRGRGAPDKKELWAYALPALFSAPLILLFGPGNIVMLSFLSSATVVGLFSIAYIYTSPIKMVPNIISQAIFPVSSEEWAIKQEKKIALITMQSLRYCYLITIPLFFFLLATPAEFLTLLATQEYIVASLALQVLAAGQIFQGLAAIVLAVLFTCGQPKPTRNIWFVGGLSNLLLVVMLVPLYGIVGNSIAFTVSSLILLVFAVLRTKKHIPFSLAGLDMLKVIVASAVLSIIAFYTKGFGGGGLVGFIFALIASAIAYIIVILFLRFFKPLDLQLFQQLENKLPKGFRHIGKIVIKIIGKFAR